MSRPSPNQARYDLTESGADFPHWNGPPRRTVIICSHPRSGTTLLGELLHQIGGVGAPLEYFHRGFRPYLQERWAADDLEAYVRAVHGWRTDPSGVFSVKLFWRDVEELAQERDPSAPGFGKNPLGSLDPAAYRRIWSLIGDLFPDPVFIHLRRADRVRQAVSALAASQSGLWRSIPGVGKQEPDGAVVYDYDRIARLVGLCDYCHGHWVKLFQALEVTPYRMTYEALDADLAREAAGLIRFLGLADTATLAPRLRRQSDAATEAMVLRFLREEALRAGPS